MQLKEALQPLDIESLRKDFPILQRMVNGHLITYLDSAATSQKPKQVILALEDYYKRYNANIHRGVYKLSEEATQAYEDAHTKVASLIDASFDEIIFTRNATEGFNLVAYAWGLEHVKEGDNIIVSWMEHHSNLVPWQFVARQNGAVLKHIRITEDGLLDMDHFLSILDERTKIVSITQFSNVLGTINDVKTIGKLSHEKGAVFIVDAAQSVPHFAISVKEIDCDFMAFSGHKMLGPTGIGVLYGKKDILNTMRPFLYGGDMISEVNLDKSSWNETPWKFEAGTPNIAGGIGLGVAADYLLGVGLDRIFEHTRNITKYALQKLSEIPGVVIYGPKEINLRGGVISFNVKGIHAHDLASILDRFGIAIRAGHHCAMPLMKRLGIQACARASFYLYNTLEDVDKLIEGINEARRIFGYVS